MKTRNEDLVTVDPEDAAAAADWARRRARAQRELADLQAERAQLHTLVSQPPGSPLLAAVKTTRTATGAAQDAATTAAGVAKASRQAAEQFAQMEVAAAEEAVDQATLALSTTLADLLREAKTTSALTATVDGLALRRRYLTGSATAPPRWDHTTLPFLTQPGDAPLDPQLVLPAIGEPDYGALLQVLQRLDTGVDAVADLITAESVHQLVQGNVVRSGAALDVAASGSVPDSFEVIRTPQTGEMVTHRVLLLADAEAAPRWPAAAGPASLADPLTAAWITSLLPDPAKIEVTATRLDPVTSAPSDLISFTLDALALDPLGLVRATADAGELAQRLALHARREWRSAGRDADHGAVRVEFGATSYALSDLISAADRVRALLAAGRALTGDDLIAPVAPSSPVAAAAAAELTARVAAVESALDATVAELDMAAASTDPYAIAVALLAASGWGVASATPQLTEELPALAALQTQAAHAAHELTSRQSAAPALMPPSDPDHFARSAQERLIALVGWRLPVSLALATSNDTEWAPVTGTAGPLPGAEPAILRAWADAYAQVRPAVAALVEAYDAAEALETGGTLHLAATQLGTANVATWLGADPDPPSGLVSVVAQQAFTAPPATITGLAVDGWTQVTCAPSESADSGPIGMRAAANTSGRQRPAVAFHYDEPDSTPPQVALVAVAPDLTAGRIPGAWDLETLCDTLLETLALARQRAVAAERSAVRGLTLRDV
ncbi:hypothetical protein [Streptomyces chartreusis]